MKRIPIRTTLATAALLSVSAPAQAESHGYPYCPTGDIVGSETIWRTTRNEARRAARIRWRRAVENTPTLGRDYTDWGLAQHPPGYYEESDGYFCRTERVLGDPWHKCAAWGVPCKLLDEPRSARLPGPGDLAREETPLDLLGSRLTIARTTPDGVCPAGFILTAHVTGSGTTGRARVTLIDSYGDDETVTIRPEAFNPTSEGKRVARVDFVREYAAATERSFRVSARLVGAAQADGPQRMNPGKSISVNCRTDGIGNLTIEPVQPVE